MVEERIVLPTRDGSCDGYVYYPDTSARYPAVVIYMDSMGMREELRVMARRLAAGGYFVLLPNLYYRLSKGDIVINADLIDEDGPDNQLMWKLNRSIYNREVVSDSESFLRFLDAHEHAGKGRVGVIGYCMSGRYAVAVAAAFREAVGFAASFYGVRIVDDHPDSAHLSIGKVSSHLYFAFAEHDHYVPEARKRQLVDTLTEHKVSFECETYEGSHHGFAFPERANYDEDASERHWAKVFELCITKLTARSADRRENTLASKS